MSRLDRLRELRRKVDEEILRELNARPHRKAAECGTDSGYYRHRRALHEPACDDCKAAHRAAENARYWRRRRSQTGAAA